MNKSVLMIDDDLVTRRIFTQKFAVDGIKATVVENAEAAVPILEKDASIGVVITDLLMPKYSGLDVIQCLRETHYTSELPIILFTSGGNPDLLTKAVASGVTKVCLKHSTPPQVLSNLVKTYLETPAH